MTLEDRREARRAALLRVGISLLGGPCGPAVNVRAVCRTASLTERYFYESFTDRDEFVRSVYATVGDEAQAALLGAVASTRTARERAEAAVEAFVELMVDNPERGRVLLLAPLSEPALSRRGMDLMPGFVGLVHDQLSAVDDEVEKQLVAIGVVGALTTLFIGYLDGTVAASREQFVAHCVTLVMEANRSGHE
ncbi:TetR/AcrR family transcriptional regulator [Rhodococcus tibetensis]|uniref:TetR/AcrR family transcriptional regulator n=1 Tax=Rhodococcus tibetensis TaxID=2965064 RepID=A0ABT1QDN9_9NOCA|nr:TetR/AcrR family transcriptional regulator [Rhodococcus sp. FXJ9.536]MCQ4120322.1 TetR/AcrR family transcriptional regulator [Rhodococcus sp. FXJ9.536]